jgi:hypothetical protein
MMGPGAQNCAGGRGPRPLPDTAREPFPLIAEHVLLPVAGPIAEADERLAPGALNAAERALALVPEDWLGTERRAAIAEFLEVRLRAPRGFVREADDARRV